MYDITVSWGSAQMETAHQIHSLTHDTKCLEAPSRAYKLSQHRSNFVTIVRDCYCRRWTLSFLWQRLQHQPIHGREDK